MPTGRVCEYWLTDSIKTETFKQYYDVVKELGRGAMSTVFLVEKKRSGIFWSVKVIKKARDKPIVRTGMGVLLRLSHPNLVRLKDAYESPEVICLVLELMTGGTLLDRLTTKGEYTEHDISQALKQILLGLKYLHDNGLVHRNLKVENFLYKDNTQDAPLKIADFAMSIIVDSDVQKRTVCDTTGYVAPETLSGVCNDSSVDMWSIGAILYTLLCGSEPFTETNKASVFKNIMKCNYTFPSPTWDDISENAKDVVSKLLVLNPKMRLTAAKALNHPWVNGKGNKSIHLETVQEKLKVYNKECKLRAATSDVRAMAKLQEECCLGRLPSHADERGERLFTDDVSRRKRVLPPFDSDLENVKMSHHGEIAEKEFLLNLQQETRIRPPFDASLEDRKSSREGDITERDHIREVERIARMMPPFDVSIEQRHPSHTGEEGELGFVERLREMVWQEEAIPEDAEPGEMPLKDAEPGEMPLKDAEPGEMPLKDAEPGEMPLKDAEPGEMPLAEEEVAEMVTTAADGDLGDGDVMDAIPPDDDGIGEVEKHEDTE